MSIRFRLTCPAVLLSSLIAPCLLCADETEDTSQVRKLLSAAAGIPAPQMRKLATSPTVPRVSAEENQPLSLVLMSLDATRVHASREQLERDYRITTENGTIPKASSIAGVMSKTQLFGYFSLIHGGTVRTVTCDIKGNSASGLVHIEIEESFRARVAYRAAKVSGKWRIEEFSLPNWRTKTQLQPDGTWKATGPAVGVARQSLPVAGHGWQSVPVDRPQVVLTLTLPEPDADSKDTPVQTYLDGDRIPPGMLEKSLQSAIPDVQQRRATTCVLRSDRRLQASVLVRTARQVQRAGFTRLALGVLGGESAASVELPFPSLEALQQKGNNPLPEIPVRLLRNPRTSRTDLELGGRNLGAVPDACDQLHKALRSLVGNGPDSPQPTVVLDFADSVQTGDLTSTISACLGRIVDGKLRIITGKFRFRSKATGE